MATIRLLFVLFSSITLGSFVPVPTQQGNNEMSSLKIQIHQLEQAVSILQSQSKVQEQKYGAVLSNVLSKLTANTEKLRNTTATLTDTQNKLTNVTSELSIAKVEYKTLEAELVAVKESLSHKPGRPLIAFQVFQNSSWTDCPRGNAIRFDSVIYNHGNGYSEDTGIFIPPVTGEYLLWSTTLLPGSTPAVSVDFQIKLGQIGSISKETELHNGLYTYVSVAVTSLAKGGKLWLTANSTESNVRILRYSAYGGVLLAKR